MMAKRLKEAVGREYVHCHDRAETVQALSAPRLAA